MLRAHQHVTGRGIEPEPQLPECPCPPPQCARELSKDEVNKLIIAPKVVDFGKVSLGSTNTLHVVLHNTLESAIHVVLDIKQDEMLRTSPNSSQVIPAGARAKFPVVLQALEIKTILERIEYAINGSHVLSFPLAADIVPVNLELSADNLNFALSLDSWDDTAERVLILDNPHKFPVSFSVESTSPLFTVSTNGNMIKAQSSAEVSVKWAPNLAGPVKQDGHLILTMVGGEAPKRIYMAGELPETNVKARDKEVNAGAVPVGVEQAASLSIKNAGTRDTAFRVLPHALVTVKPDKGKISSEETIDLDLTFACQAPGAVDAKIEIEIRGGKVLKVPFKVEAVVPQVDIAQDEFDFGEVFIGSQKRLPLELVNSSAVPATLMVDLTSHPEFYLSIAKEAWSPQEYEACPLTRIGAMGEEKAPRFGSRMGSNASSRRTSRRASSSSFTAHGNEGAKFKITLNPNARLPLQFVFRPVKMDAHALELAMAVMCTGAVSVPPLRKVATAEGVQPRIMLSKAIIDFETKIVIRTNTVKLPYSLDIYITNTSEWACAGPPPPPPCTCHTCMRWSGPPARAPHACAAPPLHVPHNACMHRGRWLAGGQASRDGWV